MKYGVILDMSAVFRFVCSFRYPRIVPKEAFTGRLIPVLHENLLNKYRDVLDLSLTAVILSCVNRIAQT